MRRDEIVERALWAAYMLSLVALVAALIWVASA